MNTSSRGARLVVAVVVGLGWLVGGLLAPPAATAAPSYFEDYFLEKYPTWPHQSQPQTCTLCHAAFPPTAAMNPYGNAFKAAKQGASIPAALAAIAAQDSDGDGVPNEVEIYFATFPGNAGSKPTAPGGLSASDGMFADKIQVGWSMYPNATFQLYRADSADGAKAQVSSTTSTQYADTTAAPGQTYTYWLKACRGAWCTDFSAPEAGTRKVAAVELPGPKPDLVCGVTAFKDEAATDAIAAGGTVTLSGASPKVWVVVKLKNVGDADVASKFESRVHYKLNGSPEANPGFGIMPPVSVGQTPRVVSMRAITVPPGTTTIDVTGTVDANNQIDEKDNANNTCGLTFTTKTTTVAFAPQARVAGPALARPGLVAGWHLKVAGLKFIQPGAQYSGINSSSNDLNLPKASGPGTFTVTVTVANSGAAASPPGGKLTLAVTGGQKVGTYGHSVNSTLVKDVPGIPAKQSVPLTFNVTIAAKDTGSYYFRADLALPK